MQIFAHRGYSAKAAENSKTAIELALLHEVSGIEIDVRLAAQQAILMHDARLERTTNGYGKVEELSLTQWGNLDAGDGYPPPSLDAVLTRVQGQCAVNIELKCQAVVPAVVTAIQNACTNQNFIPQQLCVSSFDHHALVQLRQYLPNHPIAPLIGACPLDYAACAEPLVAQAIHTHVETTNQLLVDDAHARGLVVRVYTVTDTDDLLHLYQMGVDAVFVNDVAWAKSVLGQTTAV